MSRSSMPRPEVIWSNQQKRKLTKADVHTLLRLPTVILIRSLPLVQPSACPSRSSLPANSGLRPRRSEPDWQYKAQPRKLSGQTSRRETVDGETKRQVFERKRESVFHRGRALSSGVNDRQKGVKKALNCTS